MPRLATTGLVGTFLLPLVATACGDDENGGAARVPTAPRSVEQAELRDRVNDVSSTAKDRVASQQELDLVSVAFSRESDRLRVTFRTVAPPGEGVGLKLIVRGPRGLKDGVVGMRHRPRRKPVGFASGIELPRRAELDVDARTVTVVAPLNEITRRPFKWHAISVSTETPSEEIADRIPNAPSSYELFPRPRRR